MVQHAILENNSQKRQYFRITWTGHQKTKPDSDGTSGSFTPAAYEEILHSLQPIYGLTSGLSNKTITKTIRQLLENLPMYSEFLSEDIRQRYQLADINYALRTIHFPLSMEELLVSRKRLVFDEFLLFILSIQMMKEKNEETPNYFPIQKTWVTEMHS